MRYSRDGQCIPPLSYPGSNLRFRVPPNLRFEIDDAESEWAYRSKFDFIHLRSMGGSFRDVSRVLQQAYDNLQPGGWIEWQEYEVTVKSDDGSLRPDSSFLRWFSLLHEASEKFGKQLNIAPTLGSLMRDTGFVNVSDNVFKVRSKQRQYF